MKGDTGPLVYPAGFLYIYSGIQYVTGGQVYPAQVWIFLYSTVISLQMLLSAMGSDNLLEAYVCFAVDA